MFRAIPSIVLLFCLMSCFSCEVTTDGCDVTKYCFRDPEGCIATDPGCRFISWKKSLNGGYDFEMSGNAGNGEKYIAFALGLNNAMETADLYYCDGTTVRSGVIRQLHFPPTQLDMENGLSTKEASTVNGVGQCILNRPASVSKSISLNTDKDFDITKEEFHLLVAMGNMNANGDNVQIHNWKTVTNNTIDFSAEPVQSVITADGCGDTKTCFKDPENCDISDSGCRYYSWVQGENGMFNFEISGGTGNGQQYIAMALGTTNEMKDADLYYCDGSAVRSGAIVQLHSPPSYYQMTGLLATTSASTVNGVAQCSFTRPSSVTKKISNDVSKDFDITKEEFYLLGAIGPMNGTHILRHNVWKTITDNKIDFSAKVEKPVEQNPIVRDGCGNNKTCFSEPNDCEVGTQACRFYSWRKKSDGDFIFEMAGGSGNGDQYIAFALGTKNAMQDADLYYCDGRTVRSGVIQDLHKPPAYLEMDNGLLTVSASTINGVAHCVMNRPAAVSKVISDGTTKNFDLDEEKYYLLMSVGNMDGEQVTKHSWEGVTDKRIVPSSDAKITTAPHVLLCLVLAILVANRIS